MGQGNASKFHTTLCQTTSFSKVGCLHIDELAANLDTNPLRSKGTLKNFILEN